MGSLKNQRLNSNSDVWGEIIRLPMAYSCISKVGRDLKSKVSGFIKDFSLKNGDIFLGGDKKSKEAFVGKGVSAYLVSSKYIN